MKLKVVLFFILMGNTTSLRPMLSWFSGTTPEFSQEDANSKLRNYGALYNYLCHYIDESLDKDNWTTRKNTPAFKWVKKIMFEKGNVVCLYLYARSALKYIKSPQLAEMASYHVADNALAGLSRFETPEMIVLKDLRECLTIMLLCLQRVTLDVMQACDDIYDLTHNQERQKEQYKNAFLIFVEKFKYLLTYLPAQKELLSLGYLNFTTIFEDTIKLRAHHSWNEKCFSSEWVKHFGWSHEWTPGSQGISFGDQENAFTSRENPRTLIWVLNMFAKVSHITLVSSTGFYATSVDLSNVIVVPAYYSWADFFEHIALP